MPPTARRLAACLAVVLVTLAALTACRDDAARPTQLVDGTPARVASVRLEGVARPAVMTAVRVGGKPGACGGGSTGQVAVHRVGVSGSSITLLARKERTVRACDATRANRWCGYAFARIRRGHILDPRLSLTCSRESGVTLGFAWIQPHPDAAYVVVAQRGYAEAYAVAGSVPVRVTTADVNVASSSARIDVTEHTANGRQIRAYTLEPQVSG